MAMAMHGQESCLLIVVLWFDGLEGSCVQGGWLSQSTAISLRVLAVTCQSARAMRSNCCCVGAAETRLLFYCTVFIWSRVVMVTDEEVHTYFTVLFRCGC